MILIVCVDDAMGMAFNGRRQSRDSALQLRIAEKAAATRLWVSEYSARLFAQSPPTCLCVATDYMEQAAPGEYCFVELADPAALEMRAEQLILYRWNRRYPSDLRFDIPIAEHGWKLAERTDFAGTSHEKITEEIYIK